MKMKKMKILSAFMTLIALNSFGQTTIPDNTNISGNWTLANSPYIVEGRAIVPIGQTLTIDPGVEIRLQSSASPTSSWFDYSAGNVGVIRVEGEIIADGTISDPIVFTRNNTGFWGTLLIDQNASNNSSFTNCVIEYAKESRNITGITTVVSFNGGISIFNNNITFHSNEVRNNNINGIYIKDVNTAFDFSSNTIYNNGSNGILIEGSIVNAINNTLYNNSITSTGSVSAIRSSNSTVYLVGNLIYNNDDFGIFTTSGGNHYIVNNTIYANSNGIRVESGANTFIHNSIIQNNTLNFATSSPGGATIEMSYSLTNSTAPTNVTSLAGNLFSSNALFTNATINDLSLQNTSPCIDQGNPITTGLNIPPFDILGNNRIDNGFIDMGAIEFQQPILNYTVTTSTNPSLGGTTTGDGTYNNGTNVTVSATPNTDYIFVNWTEGATVVSTNSSYTFTLTGDRDLVANFESTLSINPLEFDEQDLIVYPNPTNDIIKVVYTEELIINIYSMNGKALGSFTSKEIDLTNFKSGMYILKIENSEGNVTTKRIVKK